MTDYQCGSCSHRSSDPDAFRQHVHRTGQVDTCEEAGIGTDGVGEAAAESGPAEGRPGRGRVAAEIGFGLAAAVAIGALVWSRKEALAELAEKVTENEYLKSAGGAGRTLNGYRGR
ncbi:hypothetical protein [Kitasatospora sp. NPDC018619]|uniref:hypothetical protein n=1 Tax=unclassified Kitasatospora TaxID=2633591 RepID=UPI0037AF25E1